MSTDFHGYGKVKADLCALKNRKVNAQRTLTHRLHSPEHTDLLLFTFYLLLGHDARPSLPPCEVRPPQGRALCSSGVHRNAGRGMGFD